MNNETAATIMEKIMTDGIYPEIRNLKHRDKTIKKELHNRYADSENKRFEFKNHGVVAKFIPKRISEIDYQGLNEFLSDLGLLVPIVKIDHRKVKKNLFIYDQLESYQLESTFYVKPSFNQLGNSLNTPEDFLVEQLKVNELIHSYVELKPKINHLNQIYERAKVRMLNCPILRKNKRLTHEYGSVSLVENDPAYDVYKIHDELGDDILIEYGKPHEEKLQHFILKGLLSKKDLEQFKTIKDIRLDFVVMTFEAEKKMLEMLNHHQEVAALNRRRA